MLSSRLLFARRVPLCPLPRQSTLDLEEANRVPKFFASSQFNEIIRTTRSNLSLSLSQFLVEGCRSENVAVPRQAHLKAADEQGFMYAASVLFGSVSSGRGPVSLHAFNRPTFWGMAAGAV